MEDMFKFIQQYVTESTNGGYICKSCGFQLNISKYVTDGSFDENNRFVTFSMPMEIPLEDIPEYEKYRSSIKIMDRIVEKIASINNISHLIGTSTTTRWKRKAIVKNVLDAILINNSYFKFKFKERKDFSFKKYGIQQNTSNFFVFDMDNNIFQVSSKDKDIQKKIKFNNILAYTIIFILLDLSDSQISFLSIDKKFFCDFDYFNKYHTVLFGDIKIVKNSEGDVTNVTDYRNLSYALYMISCKLAKHNIWKGNDNEKIKPGSKKLIPIVQKSIIYTVVDLINCLLDNSFREKPEYELEMFRTKLYDKMSTSFNNEELYTKIKNEGKSSTTSENKNFIMLKSNIMPAVMTVKRSYDPPIYMSCRQSRFYMPYGTKYNVQFLDINAFTNCNTGDFHIWKNHEKTVECTICKSKLSSLLSSGETKGKNEKILENFKLKAFNNKMIMLLFKKLSNDAIKIAKIYQILLLSMVEKGK